MCIQKCIIWNPIQYRVFRIKAVCFLQGYLVRFYYIDIYLDIFRMIIIK